MNDRSELRTIDWPHIMEEALTAPGDLGSLYNRFYVYSYLNQIYLLSQGVYEPIATRSRWREVNRRVIPGSIPKEIIRPVVIEEEQPDGTKAERLIGFKPVACIYGFSETEGPELPPAPIPEWDEETALRNLRIRRIGFTALNPNIQGYSRNRDIAVNPVAVNPTKTLLHELGHIVLGHTTPRNYVDYTRHRGLLEFEAEGTAYLALKELGQLDEQTASASRAYIRNWMDNQRPPDSAIRHVFGATETILKAGRIALGSSGAAHS